MTRRPPVSRRSSLRRTLRRGYSLIELTIVMLVGIGIATILMGLMNQQFTMLRLLQTQNFLADEAPLIDNMLSRIISQADHFSIHASRAAALAGTSPVLTGGSALRLEFRQPDGTVLKGILSYESLPNMGQGLYYFNVPATGVISTPDWAVTKRPTAVSFQLNAGVLGFSLTGPAGEVITYSATMQR